MNAYHLLFMCQCVPHYGPRILQTFFFNAILPSWMTWCTFSTYSVVYLMMCHLNVKIHNQSVATFEAIHAIQRFVFYLWCYHKRFFLSILWVLEASFSRWQQTSMQILFTLSSPISPGYKNCRMHSTQTHLNVSCTKTHCSVTVTLIKLIHNKSPLQYLAVHSCIISCLCFIFESRNIWLTTLICWCNLLWKWLILYPASTV